MREASRSIYLRGGCIRHFFFRSLSISHVYSLNTASLILYNVPEQLFKCLQEPPTERTEPVHAAAVPASIPCDGASANLLVIAPECRRLRDHLFRIASAVFMCLGYHVRASSREDHPRACHQDRLSFIGLYLDMEHNRCSGRESAQTIWPVSFRLLFVFSSLFDL